MNGKIYLDKIVFQKLKPDAFFVGYFFFVLALGCLSSQSEAAAVGECVDGVQFLLDDSNCNLYYQCDHGEAVQRSCPGNLYFDLSTSACNWPDLVTCDVSSNSSEEEEVEGSGEVGESDNSWIGECPAENGEVVDFLQHASDCNKYYVCDNGQPILMTCPPDMHFNIVLEVCDWAEDAGCDVNLFRF
ncbi:chitin binding peritrophin-a [Holotrichia oblita]|uniref:Chitin binding peritrophin-a n=2 Tax=Holotrichia oblita TaxID=644536 RepID=A0ACB9TKY7_HOLOL|nr:chitin binding peritrophin-a [Holotrichia oblita]KAI4467497.1 chitin binding peritrophin-a [Holotrichia oblita]